MRLDVLVVHALALTAVASPSLAGPGTAPVTSADRTPEPVGADPRFRRRGLARAVLGALAREAADLGALSLHLQVESANAAARTLYAEVGFTTHHAYAYLSP